jgi:uncharacterized protein YqjF (DUF2071 family)
MEVLRPLVPRALEIDTFDGEAFVGIVPFTMTNVRPLWMPRVPGVTNFHETNVRTYVHHRGEDPGVWFFSLDAAGWLAAAVARALWHLPYHHARMTLERTEEGIRYTSERLSPPSMPVCNLTCLPLSTAAPAAAGSLEQFLAERYFLYASGGDGALYRSQVHHAPYPLQTARVTELKETLLAAAGIERPGETPLEYYASSVDVEIFALERMGVSGGGA